MKLKKNISLKSYHTFGINVRARLFTEVTSETDLKEIINNKDLADQNMLILGGGSNILFTDDFDGLVIKNSITGIEKVKEDNDHVYVKAYSGEVWHEFVLWCIDRGYAGIENLSLIPGSVGAAPMQNIGAYGVELEEVFEELKAVDMQTGEKKTFKHKECCFGYRDSIFKNKAKGRYFILSVILRLNKKPRFNLSYGTLQSTLDEMNVTEPTLKSVSDAVCAIRSSKLPDPREIGNAGSFFKNPEITEKQFNQIKKQFPDVPHYPLPGGMVKVPAGWMIEQCGWKGKRIGDTGSHKQQALVLVNYGKAEGQEVWKLAEKILASVKEKFGIQLQPEVNVV